jgi:hypothetical protein
MTLPTSRSSSSPTRRPAPRRTVRPCRANGSASSATAAISAVSTSGVRARGSGWSSFGMSAANSSRRVGASAQSQAVMSSNRFRSVSTTRCATTVDTCRPAPARARRPRQDRVRFQIRNSSISPRRISRSDPSSGCWLVSHSANGSRSLTRLSTVLGRSTAERVWTYRNSARRMGSAITTSANCCSTVRPVGLRRGGASSM